MPRKTSSQPADGGAVTENSQTREPVVQMLAPGTDKEFEASLPESTMGTGTPEVPTKRKRRTKEEMAAARGEVLPPVNDPRYDKAVAKMSGMGGAQLLKVGFKTAGKPLAADEVEDVDDCFYVISKKSGLNPAENWFLLALYTIGLLARLIVVRTELGDELKKFFEPKPEKDEVPEETERLAHE